MIYHWATGPMSDEQASEPRLPDAMSYVAADGLFSRGRSHIFNYKCNFITCFVGWINYTKISPPGVFIYIKWCCLYMCFTGVNYFGMFQTSCAQLGNLSHSIGNMSSCGQKQYCMLMSTINTNVSLGCSNAIKNQSYSKTHQKHENYTFQIADTTMTIYTIKLK